MSEEQLKAFIAKVQSDDSLQEQLKAEGADPIAIAKAAGFTIKQQDILRQASELSDEELEGMSGGMSENYDCTATTIWLVGVGTVAINTVIMK
jgi:predicted ribosomally synthesized peptide with nif11-like leader